MSKAEAENAGISPRDSYLQIPALINVEQAAFTSPSFHCSLPHGSCSTCKNSRPRDTNLNGGGKEIRPPATAALPKRLDGCQP